MELRLTEKQYRRLLDLVYIGNWVLNSTRGDDRIRDYDKVESLVFSHCLDHGMAPLIELYNGEIIPSRAFAEGGIHEAIMAYEDVTFFEILAEELALRDLDADRATAENYDEVMERMEEYMGEFEAHGTDHISVDACRPDCQLMSALFCFRIMNDHMDRSTFPCDTTHLPGISVYEREVVRYSSGDCFLFLHHQIKFDVIIYRRNVLKLLCDTILSGSLQKLIERSLSIN